MRQFLTTIGRFVLKLFGLVARFQTWLLEKVCPRIPGWSAILAFCRLVLQPVHRLGAWFQRKWEWVRKAEWLLEIDALRSRHPVMLVFALTMVALRGIRTTDLGHIGTDAFIYPLLGGISYLNPYLGLVSAMVFGAADLLQKLFVNDMYGTDKTGDYVGGLLGYVIAYTSLAFMGLLPGMLSRVFSLAVRKILKAVFFREAAAAADGVGDGAPGPGVRLPAGTWKQALDAGHPVSDEWQKYLAGRGLQGAGAQTFDRLRVPPEGLGAYLAEHGAPPGGWKDFCAATGLPMDESFLRDPASTIGFGSAADANAFLATYGIPGGPPVPSATDWLTLNATRLAAADQGDIAAAARARARHAAEELEIQRALDAARARGQAGRNPLDALPRDPHGNVAGAIIPMTAGGPPDAAYVVPELIASIVGAALGGWAVVSKIAPVTEWPAFYLRPNPDVSCYSAEVGYLKKLASDAASGTSTLGPVLTGLTPPTGPLPPGGPMPPGGPIPPGGPQDAPPDEPAPTPPADPEPASPQTPPDDDGVLSDPRAEMDRMQKQWDEVSKTIDPKDPGYDAYKKQYDDYTNSLKDRISADEAAKAAAEAEARAAQEAAERQAEWVHQREEDLKQVREQQSFVAAVGAGASQAGFDTKGTDRTLRDLEIRERELVGKISAAGGSTSYTARQRDVIKVGEGFKESIRIAQEQKRQAAIAAAKVRHAELVKEREQLDRDYWKTIKEGFWQGVVSDVDSIPGQLRDAAKAGLKTIGDTVVGVGREITDANNWRALGQTVVQTGKDLVGSPIQSARKVGGFYRDVAGTGAKVVAHVVTHPVDTIKAVTGYDNWEKTMDPNVPVTERMGRVILGVVDAAVNLTGVGAAAKGLKAADAAADAVRMADKVVDAARAADKASDAAKAARAADAASDAAKATRAADAASDAARAADRASDAARSAKAADGASDAAKAGRGASAPKPYGKKTPDELAKAHEEWRGAQVAGKSKVDEFEKARADAKAAWKSGDPAAEAAAKERLRKATLDVQGDKQALWEINKRPDAVKKGFNKEMGEVYQKTDCRVVDDVCRQNGIDASKLREQPPGSGVYYNELTGRPDVVIVKPTNPKAGISVGADRDVTVRIRKYGDELVADPNNPGQFVRAGDKGVLTDVPARDLEPIYDDAFHQAADADKLYPGSTPKEFAHTMDQVATDRLHAEAYGRGQKDLAVAIRKPGEAFSDAQQVSMAAQYKSEHLYDQSHKLAAQGRVAEAQTAMAEGVRQSTKQFDRQILGRADALAKQGVDVRIPERLREEMAIMKKIQTEGWSPARVSTELAKRGTSIEDVTQRSASMIEAMQKLRPR